MVVVVGVTETKVTLESDLRREPVRRTFENEKEVSDWIDAQKERPFRRSWDVHLNQLGTSQTEGKRT